MSGYAIRLSPAARRRLLTIPRASYEKVSALIDSLQTMPYRGRVYDPIYDAARLPFECRVAYSGQHGVYYTVHDSERLVYIRYIEDQRRDPRRRFDES